MERFLQKSMRKKGSVVERLDMSINRKKMLRTMLMLAVTVSTVALCMVALSGTAFAAPPEGTTETTEDLWNTITGIIKTWATRLGGVVMFVGGIMFGLGWKSDDAEQKSRGISTLIAGGIVIAVAALTSKFFA